MDKIAFFAENITLYWYSIILALAAGTAICFFVSLYLGKGGHGVTAAVAVPLAMFLSLVLSRLVHWYCRSDSYSGFLSAMTDYTSGGYALLGSFAGCLLAAVILRLTRLSQDLPQMLDCMCLGGSAGIGLGRLACFYSPADRGQVISFTSRLPWVYPVSNTVSGAVENRFATFLFQAMAAGLIFLVLLVFSLTRESNGKKRASGETTLLFLLLYGASQVLLDSTRYDSLFFRSNGFVSVVQVFSACALAFVIVMYSIRMVRCRGFRVAYLILWLGIAAAIGGVGYMEYYVQRHGDRAAFAYGVMALCLFVALALALIIRRKAVSSNARTSRSSGQRPGRFLQKQRRSFSASANLPSEFPEEEDDPYLWEN